MTIQAVKFKTWNIPKAGRLDPFNIPFKSSLASPFRMDGAISLYGRQRKPLSEKTHTTTFVLSKGCEADLQFATDDMMNTLLSGSGRLWFNNFSMSNPLLFCEGVQPNSINWTPNNNQWSSAVFDIEWELPNSILYRPLPASFYTAQSFGTQVIPDNVFGESWEERTFAFWDITASPTNIVINNPGHMRTHRIILRIDSAAVGGFSNVKILNNDTDQFFQYTPAAVDANAVLQANCALGANRVRLSPDLGASFVDTPDLGNVWPDCLIDARQVPIMEFIQGDNNLTITSDGAVNFRLLIMWQPAYGMI